MTRVTCADASWGRESREQGLGHARRIMDRLRPSRGGGVESGDRTGAEPVNDFETVRRARRPYLAGANPARQLSLPPVAIGAAEGGNDLG